RPATSPVNPTCKPEASVRDTLGHLQQLLRMQIRETHPHFGSFQHCLRSGRKIHLKAPGHSRPAKHSFPSGYPRRFSTTGSSAVSFRLRTHGTLPFHSPKQRLTVARQRSVRRVAAESHDCHCLDFPSAKWSPHSRTFV